MNQSDKPPASQPHGRLDAIQRMQQIIVARDNGISRKELDRTLDGMEMINATLAPQLRYLVSDLISRLHCELDAMRSPDSAV